jgi:hypothetical protein
MYIPFSIAAKYNSQMFVRICIYDTYHKTTTLTIYKKHCGVGNYIKLDHLQVEVARIATGLPIFASSILIYKELAGNH